MAKNIVVVYLVLTGLCIIGYMVTGMRLFDAINHAFTTLSTGGYSTSDGSMNHFSNGSHWVATLFMFLGGLPFLLFVTAMRKRRPQELFKDAQVQGFFLLFIISSLIVAAWLHFNNGYAMLDAARPMFNIVSVVTTTGYGLDDFTAWGALPSTILHF